MRKKVFFLLALGLSEAINAAVFIKLLKEQEKKKQALKKGLENMTGKYALAVEWVRLLQRKRSIPDYLKERGYHTAIIYGLSDIGLRLYDELKDSAIKIICLLDQNAFGKVEGTKIFSPNDHFPQADIIIVATPFFLLEIEKALLDKTDCPIVALDDLITEMMSE